jgi:hypothetical protein
MASNAMVPTTRRAIGEVLMAQIYGYRPALA